MGKDFNCWLPQARKRGEFEFYELERLGKNIKISNEKLKGS